MSIYAIGDVQGCYTPLCRLLESVGFDPARDRAWFVGDLVNRGPQSLEVLRLVRSFGASATVVLGNHDLHLIKVADSVSRLKAGDTLQPVLDAPDRPELVEWLRQMPLVHYEREVGFCMVHAGIPPQWDLDAALARAREAERWIRSGDWSRGSRRVQTIMDSFTRMRFCTADGRLELRSTSGPEDAPEGYLPWFAHPERRTATTRIVFGHWAALHGRARADNVYALDTGCVWGQELTLMRLEDGRRFGCRCESSQS